MTTIHSPQSSQSPPSLRRRRQSQPRQNTGNTPIRPKELKELLRYYRLQQYERKCLATEEQNKLISKKNIEEHIDKDDYSTGEDDGRDKHPNYYESNDYRKSKEHGFRRPVIVDKQKIGLLYCSLCNYRADTEPMRS